MTDTERILAELATALTGRPVRVVFHDPGRPDAAALTYRTPRGFQILLRPGLAARDTFRAFLHECAHIVADGDCFAVVERPPTPSEVVSDPSLEARADAIGDALMRLVPRWCTTVADMGAAVLDKVNRRRNRR